MARHVVATAREIAPGGRLRVTVDGRAIVIFNAGGKLYAIRDTCPHRGANLSDGKVVGALASSAPGHYQYDPERVLVRCPWHMWEFDLATGRSWIDPARLRIKPYAVDVVPGGDLHGDEQSCLVPGPYVAETFAVDVEEEYVVLEV